MEYGGGGGALGWVLCPYLVTQSPGCLRAGLGAVPSVRVDDGTMTCVHRYGVTERSHLRRLCSLPLLPSDP